MRRIDALELKNKSRAEVPLVVLATRRRAPACDEAGRLLQVACDEAGVEFVGVDVDDKDPAMAVALDELGVTAVPAVCLFSRGVLLERAVVVRDAIGARRLVAMLPGSSRVR